MNMSFLLQLKPRLSLVYIFVLTLIESSIMSDKTVKCQMLKLVGHVPASSCCSSLRNARSVIMILGYMLYKIFLPSADMQ